MDTNNQPVPSENKKNIGPIIATLVIVLILIVGALYVLASHISQQTLPADALNTSSTTVQVITNKSDDVNSLQSDLNSATDGLNNQNF
jgi:hypothetical protein